MTAPDAIHWPEALAALEIEHIIDTAEDNNVGAIPAPDMAAQFSDDLGFVYRQVRIAEEQNISIEAAMSTAQTAGDDDAYDAACEAFDAAYNDLVTLERRLLEMEDREARAEERELRRNYYQSIL